MTRYFRLQPWPAADFAAEERTFLPDGSDGVCALPDDATPPDSAVEILAAAYAARRQQIRDAIAALPVPVDPELQALRATLAKDRATVAPGEVRDALLTALARLERRGLL